MSDSVIVLLPPCSLSLGPGYAMQGHGGNVISIAVYAMPTIRNVAFIGYHGTQSLDLAGPLEVFAMANSRLPEPRYALHLASPDGGEIRTNGGLVLAGATPLADLPELDTLLVAGGSEEGLASMQAPVTLDWLRQQAAATRRVGSVCSGAFVLAAAGLLDGRRATTHWGACDALRQARPQIRLEPDAIFVADPPIYTSAGVTAGIDLALSMVEADFGPELARAIARHLVLFMRRPGGQTQFSAGLDVQAGAAPKLQRLIAEVISDPRGALDVPNLAERAGMSERTFSRVFRQQTGTTPAAFVEQARVDRAKALLEASDWTLERIAERSGFGSIAALHRAFRRRVGSTPGEYRDRFGQA
jgi:transcriptional regulator GlxA family with amidase domain